MGRRTSMLAGGLLVLSVALVACEKVNKPTSDSTPPVLTWNATNTGTGDVLNVDGTGSMQATLGDHFKVILKAEDPEGIHQISLDSEQGFTCTKGRTAKSGSTGGGSPMTQTLEPDSQNKVLTSIVLIDDAVMAAECQSGFQLSGVKITFTGTGTNYFNGKVSATLTIKT